MAALAVGDSITQGVLGDGTCVHVDCVADRPYPTVLQALLDAGTPGFLVLNGGRGGETTDGGLARLALLLAAYHPAIVLVMEGTNDATFQFDPAQIVANLRAMVQLAKAHSSIPILGAIVPNFRDAPEAQAIIAAVNAALPGVAAEEDVRFVDTFSAMNDPSLFGPVDILHPNQHGYDVLGAAWQSAATGAIADMRTLLGGAWVAAGALDGGAAAQIVTGAGPGGGPHVRAFRADGTDFGVSFFAYGAEFRGGVRVAVCDVDGDKTAEIVTAAGPGGGPHVRVIKRLADGTLVELASFYAFAPEFRGGVFVACGNLDGSPDGRAEIVVAAGRGGGPHVRAFRYTPGAPGGVVDAGVNFYAYGPGFTGGVSVAAGVMEGDRSGRALIVTGAGPGGAPHVRAFYYAPGAPGGVESLGPGFYAYDPAFTGGVWVGAGQVPGASLGTVTVITGPGRGGGPDVRVFQIVRDGTVRAVSDFFAYAPDFQGGVHVTVADGDVVSGAGPGGQARVRGFTPGGVPTGLDFLAY